MLSYLRLSWHCRNEIYGIGYDYRGELHVFGQIGRNGRNWRKPRKVAPEGPGRSKNPVFGPPQTPPIEPLFKGKQNLNPPQSPGSGTGVPWNSALSGFLGTLQKTAFFRVFRPFSQKPPKVTFWLNSITPGYRKTFSREAPRVTRVHTHRKVAPTYANVIRIGNSLVLKT